MYQIHSFMTPPDLLTASAPVGSLRSKLTDLRALMEEHQLDAYLIPSADEHLNEYLPQAKQRREWISGFTGSAGDLLVGRDWVWLFVDSRYHEQADLQVDTSLILVSKLGLEGHKTLIELLETLGQEYSAKSFSFRLGFDPFTLAVEQFRSFQEQVEANGVELVSDAENFVDQVRTQQEGSESDLLSTYATSHLFALPDRVTGETMVQKLVRVREALQKSKTNLLPITKLDQIAWLFNLRGRDIPYNPVFIAYAVVTLKEAYVFTNLQRIDAQVQEALHNNVTLLPYERYEPTLTNLISQLQPARILVDPKHTTQGTYQLLKKAKKEAPDLVKIVEAANPIEGMKARKNAIEIEQMQQANLKASRAKVRTIKWVSNQLANNQTLTELDVAQKIEEFYAQESDFQGLSFNTIAAAGANSSIVHYSTPSSKIVLTNGQFFLLDSGAQYLMGTTDDTRTLIVGTPTSEQIDRYTEVLKAHINCAMQRFPKGTTGIHLDGIARSDLWMAELDYGHGTGHGVGAFLNVHEGPNGISKRAFAPLELGMVTSIEPGFYAPGWGGIRIENLYIVKSLTPETQTQIDPTKTIWYGFESLTYIPFDKRLIALDKLDLRQRQWLLNYHAAIVEKLSPTLETTEASWLREVCRL